MPAPHRIWPKGLGATSPLLLCSGFPVSRVIIMAMSLECSHTWELHPDNRPNQRNAVVPSLHPARAAPDLSIASLVSSLPIRRMRATTPPPPPVGGLGGVVGVIIVVPKEARGGFLTSIADLPYFL